MSLPNLDRHQSLFSVSNLLGTQFDPQDRFRIFAERIYPLLLRARPVLAGCYCADNGRPAVEPVVLMGISLLQFMERESDRSAMEQVRYHAGWKLALGLGLEIAAPDPSLLVVFRQRLLEHGQAKLAFDTVLEGLREAGRVPKRSRQRLDSTHVLGEHHSYLQQRRREQKTEEFARQMHHRNGIEGTISELTRGHGLRQARYRGLAKVSLQNYFIGAACNAKRYIRLLTYRARQGSLQAVQAVRGVPALTVTGI